jgi:signal transduction histidine kinase
LSSLPPALLSGTLRVKGARSSLWPAWPMAPGPCEMPMDRDIAEDRVAMPCLLSISIGNYFNGSLQLLLVFTVAVLAPLSGYLLVLRHVTKRLQKRVEARLLERERTVRELYDSLLQDFQGITLQVQGITKKISSEDPLRGRMEEVLDRADEALSEARQRARGLNSSSPSQEETR